MLLVQGRPGPADAPQRVARRRVATQGRRSFYDEQGAVYARVSVNFATKFGCLLEMGVGLE